MNRYGPLVNRLTTAERALAFSTLLPTTKQVSGHKGLQGATKRQGSTHLAASDYGLLAQGSPATEPKTKGKI